MKIYLICHHNYDDCNHLGYVTDETEAGRISEEYNKKHGLHMGSNMCYYEEIESMTICGEQRK